MQLLFWSFFFNIREQPVDDTIEMFFKSLFLAAHYELLCFLSNVPKASYQNNYSTEKPFNVNKFLNNVTG